ncbi:DUF5709 domain-containing protein [Pseudonocardia sp. MH-G8]|uniref:DUF5709 domain-containing protein n=1 Tax=Pseudonocardia sp. MH-G8 TaxID=1854588 RepID=UPI000B9FB662|nr:DUF5709 domain-containing protein [Pseudonocardia sp. MH-G8]OZM80996.1 hypothetical protein CFP66_16430 [Pseudonocardia sp. MH-G8]
MAQRDYEEQPEAPDLGASVQLESDEHLAAPPGDRDGLDAGYSPPDRPYAAEEDGVTARGMREGDSLDERLRRERGDQALDEDRSGRIAVEGEGAALETPDAMDGVDVGVDGGGAGAEEAAVHVVDDPGAPVETEPSVAGSPALDDPELDAVVGGDPRADRARSEAARDVRAEGQAFDPGMTGAPVAEGSEDTRGPAAPDGGDPAGGDLTGRGPDPSFPRDPFDADPARRGFADSAESIDESPDARGAAAGASGRDDAGPEAWRR